MSTNDEVLEVVDGIFVAKSAGGVHVTAVVDGIEKKCRVEVVNAKVIYINKGQKLYYPELARGGGAILKNKYRKFVTVTKKGYIKVKKGMRDGAWIEYYKDGVKTDYLILPRKARPPKHVWVHPGLTVSVKPKTSYDGLDVTYEAWGLEVDEEGTVKAGDVKGKFTVFVTINGIKYKTVVKVK